MRDTLLVLVEELRLVRRREFAIGLAPHPVVTRRHHVPQVVRQQCVPFLETPIVEQPGFVIEKLLDRVMEFGGDGGFTRH